MSRVLSGVQPTGNLHLGNYLGAIKRWVGLQQQHECLFMLADLHAITVPQNPVDLSNATREVTAAYLACGVDPDKSVIFPQSAVSAHAELGWILSCHTPMGWLERMTQFKEKAQQSKASTEIFIDASKTLLKKIKKIQGHLESDSKNESRKLSLSELLGGEAFKADWGQLTSQTGKMEEVLAVVSHNLDNMAKAKLGLYAYPVLMAADILAYKATHVPVGEDQKQHLELSRDIAGAFNRAYKMEYFPLPEPLIMGAATRVMSLRDGSKKMSKSEESDYSRINLTDDAEAISLKFQKAKSDMLPGITYDPETRPECSNLINIFAALQDLPRETILKEYENANFSTFKKAIADCAIERLAPITALMRELVKDPGHIDGILSKGAERANKIAQKYLKEVKEMIGFVRL